jgi:hypothetical protein
VRARQGRVGFGSVLKVTGDADYGMLCRQIKLYEKSGSATSVMQDLWL